MNTLSISQIFSKLDYYQENYLSIIHSPEQYYTPVLDAYVHVWPLKKQALYLGDLLQLWFAEKWIVTPAQHYILEQYLAAQDVIRAKNNIAYIYAINANSFTRQNKTQIWSTHLSQSQTVVTEDTVKYYCEFLACERPLLQQQAS